MELMLLEGEEWFVWGIKRGTQTIRPSKSIAYRFYRVYCVENSLIPGHVIVVCFFFSLMLCTWKGLDGIVFPGLLLCNKCPLWPKGKRVRLH